MNQTQIDSITAQSIKEISFARSYKQNKITGWKKNEDLYYNKKVPTTESRANVNLGGGQEFVHTLWSKIKTPLIFKYIKRKESQLQRVNRLNALRQQDAQSNFWSIKDSVGKKQAIIYGRAIYFYYADSIREYKAHNEPTDVYDFLIDPSAGGIDIELAGYLGRFGVIKTRKELEDGIKDKTYIKSETNRLLEGDGNNTAFTQEETNKQNRSYGVTSLSQKELQSKDKFKFWEWFTTYEGVRYKVLLNEQMGSAIEIIPLRDIFSIQKGMIEAMWPCWTWAAYPDLTEFWTPSPMDYIRDIIEAQNVSINQMLDNAEAVNKPQKAVQVGMIENLSQLKYRRDGLIHVKNGVNVNEAVQLLKVAPIDTPLAVFEVLEKIKSAASGVTEAAKGVADEEGRVAIYEGNREEAADRYGLIHDSYAIGMMRFAKLYEIGIQDHLTKKIAVDMIGPNGIETEYISKRDVKKKDDEFGVMVDTLNSEKLLSASQQRAKMTFLGSQVNNQEVNQKKVFELQASIVGFDEDTIKELLDKSDYGNISLMAECARDIESIIDGEDIKPNDIANNAYKQKMVDYMVDHKEDMDEETWARFEDYITKIEPVIMKNEARLINKFEVDQLNASALMSGNNAPAIKTNPTQQTNEEATGEFGL